jgi:hypothetical protein
MAVRYPEDRHRTTVAEAEHVEHVVVDSPATRNAGVFRFEQAIYLLFGLIEILIAMRFALLALGANPNSPFAAAIYGISSFFVAPFTGIFGSPQLGTNVFEPASLVAILVYAMLAWMFGKLVWLMMGDTSGEIATSSRVVESEHDHHHHDHRMAA